MAQLARSPFNTHNAYTSIDLNNPRNGELSLQHISKKTDASLPEYYDKDIRDRNLPCKAAAY